MMRALSCLLLSVLALAPAFTASGPDVNHLEGNDKLRARLQSVQGEPLPEFDLTGWLGSEALTLADLQGKIVVLDFWAVWCGPCIKSIPTKNALAERYKDRVLFIGVCHPQEADRLPDVVKQHEISYPVAIDQGESLSKALQVNGYPDYYIVDVDGTIWAADVANDRLEAALKQLVAQRK